MDIRISVKDGFEAIKDLREFERSDAKNIPILAMTADAFLVMRRSVSMSV